MESRDEQGPAILRAQKMPSLRLSEYFYQDSKNVLGDGGKEGLGFTRKPFIGASPTVKLAL